MKKKAMTILLTGALTAAMAGTAYAAPTKTATLNNAQVRFNGGAVQTLQCYNIDGFNYVRARDITNNLNMALYPVLNGETGVMVDPTNKPTSKATPEKLTQKTAQVKVETGNLIYDGTPSKADCFLLNGRYYFKLADFQKAAEYQKGVAQEMVEIEAKGEYATAPYRDIFYSIAVDWNADSRVIDVKRTETDLQAIFNNIRGGKTETTKTDTSKTDGKKNNESTSTVVQQTKGTGVLKSAPKEGEILANILIDKSKGAYLENGKPNWDNMTTPYANAFSNLVGQCTWYAEGRFFETHGFSTANNTFANARTYLGWVTNAQSGEFPDVDGTTDPQKIEAGCIAMFEGHALFVEWVDYDDNGNPKTVYFTEGNAGHKSAGLEAGVYYPDFDGKVKVMDFDKFIVRQPFVGYVLAK